jgi:type IX secretion system PorP/SprF family membrane protein
MKSISTIIIFSFFIIQIASAQDPRFAQFYASPMNLNPAMTGVYEGQFRFVANYRELYSSVLGSQAFRTVSAGFDTRQRVSRGNFVGLGLNLMRDAAGLSNFNRHSAAVSASFMKQLGGGRYSVNDQYLIAGAQVGFGQQGLNWNKLWFSNQYDVNSGAVNYDNPTGESFVGENSKVYLDFNAGVLWYALFEENQSIYFGGAFYHLNAPNISFLNQEAELPRRWVVHGGGELPLTKQLSLLPAAAVMGQNKSMSVTTGANFRFTNREWKELALRAGGWVHVVNRLDSGFSMDAITATAILELERWNLGFSYDMTTSDLTQANNGRGAFEVSLIYTQPAKSRVRVNCPNF